MTVKFKESDYEQEIAQIVKKIKTFKESGDKADESFLEVGDLLVKTKKEKNLEDKIFTKLKRHVAKSLSQNGLRNINKVVSIAQCEAIQNNKDKLPKGWSTLYILSRAENIDELITSGKVKSDTARSAVMKLLKKEQPKKMLFVEFKGENVYTDEDLAELKTALSSTKWSLKAKA